jgi:D-glycero-D-manno-heptose 1,7-bisphosphate phosphatase
MTHSHHGENHAIRRAVFFDRDGTLVVDRGPVRGRASLETLQHVPQALRVLHERGFALVVVTNQAVVARGLASEEDVCATHTAWSEDLAVMGAPAFDGIYFCPHHPHADVLEYRVDCRCRKPFAGMLEQAASELAIDLSSSFMVGDRLSDVAAGKRIGCRTVLVSSPATEGPSIVTSDDYAKYAVPDHRCDNLSSAVAWILGDAVTLGGKVMPGRNVPASERSL